MKCRKAAYVLGALALFGNTMARADLIITEVDAAGNNATYAADWFEVTNTGAAAVDMTGWKMDDGSNAIGTAVAIRFSGSISTATIAPGQSVIFAEGNTTGTTDATIQTAFISAWFGGTAPAGFAMNFYGGTGVGLSTSGGDGVNLFDSGDTHVVGVSFGVLTSILPATLDNAALAGDGSTLSTASVAGVNGAFNSGTEIGSPGRIVNPAPEPATLGVLGLAGAALLLRRRRA